MADLEKASAGISQMMEHVTARLDAGDFGEVRVATFSVVLDSGEMLVATVPSMDAGACAQLLWVQSQMLAAQADQTVQ